MNENIKTLLSLSNEALQSQEKCLTIYHTLNNLEDAIASREIKSLCTQALENSEIKDLDKVIEGICEIIVHNALKLKREKPGIAIFYKFSPLKFDKEDIELNSHNLNIFYSDFRPQTKLFFENIFDLSTIHLMDTSKNCLYINISYGETDIYTFDGSRINLIKKIDNKILESMEDRFTYVQKTAPAIGSGGVQSSSGNFQEKKDKFARMIINNAIEEIKEISNGGNKYETIIITHSPDFSNEKNHLIENLKHLSSNPILVKQENIDYEKNLEEKLKGIVENYKRDSLSTEINEAKTRIDRILKQNPEEIMESVRNANVYKFYMKEGASHEGFLYMKDLPYVEPYETSEKVEDILPWIIKKALEVDAEVYILDREDKIIESNFALIPRY